MKAIQIKSEDIQKVKEATESQTLGGFSALLGGEEKIFTMEALFKYLIYIPNIFKKDAEGNPVLNEIGQKVLDVEAPFIATVRSKQQPQFQSFRDTTGLKGLEEYGISGNPVFQEGRQLAYEIIQDKLSYKKIMENGGVDFDEKVGKEKYLECAKDRAFSQSNKFYFVPIIVFKPQVSPSKTYVNYLQPNLPLSQCEYDIFWYKLSQSKLEVLSVALNQFNVSNGGVDFTAPQNKELFLGGNYFLLDFTDTSNSSKDFGGDKGAAVKNMTAQVMGSIEGAKELAPSLDAVLAHMTPDLARTNIRECALFPDSEISSTLAPNMDSLRLEHKTMRDVLAQAMGNTTATAIGTTSAPTPDEVLGGYGIDTAQPQASVQPPAPAPAQEAQAPAQEVQPQAPAPEVAEPINPNDMFSNMTLGSK